MLQLVYVGREAADLRLQLLLGLVHLLAEAGEGGGHLPGGGGGNRRVSSAGPRIIRISSLLILKCVYENRINK